MGSERLAGKRPPPTPQAAQRRKLANITNLQFVEENPVKVELQQDVAKLKSQVEAQAAHIEKLELALEQKSAQNEEIIQHYYRQYKELEQARQEMKLLQHEYTQMCSVYRISKSELQSQLEEANEQIRRLTEKENQPQRKKSKSPLPPPPSMQAKPTRKRRSTRVVSTKVQSYCPASIKVEEEPELPEFVTSRASSPGVVIKTENFVRARAVSTSGRPVRRAVETVSSYKEPPLNTKMRRPG
ncbi:shugoshin-1-like [Selaginella moellendorffii]|uniref:shugoshin-1-like n=1 Tax=Selaginella moellendorffii TaxID=88036 RepID=UPI000D1C7DB0|nr:shugoshin-1-like [Selaginella moellendorffii]XP_024516170.1 shugoshin-1-like [Selaginella moellendorffii]XP_024525252.1 shugoshin-1-like [Selaginella moellendorffii]XP_024525253.1 shugoshin-1-like [Selaginella moellendorffii]|eukprot:XP_024516169.1 shugoshin-1-like [Selaginella moellendorffii]